jgi:hypothetical protein
MRPRAAFPGAGSAARLTGALSGLSAGLLPHQEDTGEARRESVSGLDLPFAFAERRLRRPEFDEL